MRSPDPRQPSRASVATATADDGNLPLHVERTAAPDLVRRRARRRRVALPIRPDPPARRRCARGARATARRRGPDARDEIRPARARGRRACTRRRRPRGSRATARRRSSRSRAGSSYRARISRCRRSATSPGTHLRLPSDDQVSPRRPDPALLDPVALVELDEGPWNSSRRSRQLRASATTGGADSEKSFHTSSADSASIQSVPSSYSSSKSSPSMSSTWSSRPHS